MTVIDQSRNYKTEGRKNNYDTQLFCFTELREQVCVDVKNGMSQEDVVAKYRAKYLEEIDDVTVKMVEAYEMLRKLEIFNYMTKTNEHLEQLLGGYDEY